MVLPVLTLGWPLAGVYFRVLRADSRRLHTLQVERIAPAPVGDDDAST